MALDSKSNIITKRELRNLIKDQIKLMTEAERETASVHICREIIGSTEWKAAKTVWLYAALPDEVNLDLLFQDAQQGGKRILLPVVDGNDLLIRVYAPEHIVTTEEYNINEPTAHCQTLSNLEEIDLAIIPGRAFTHNGLRMGRGKGYYDRTLPSLHCPKWGVAFACQMVEDIPTDSWDVQLDRIIYEKSF